MKYFLLSLAVLLSGCASSDALLKGNAAIDAGRLSVAESHYRQAISEGEMVGWNNLGIVYWKMDQKDKAISYFKMGARYGVPDAQQNLIRLGQQVPAADLLAAPAANTTSSSSGAAALLEGAAAYQEGRQQRRSAQTFGAPSVSCNSRRQGTMVYTDCN